MTDRVAGVPRGSAINRTGTVRRMLGHMRRDLPRPQLLNEWVRVIVLIAAQRDASGGGRGLDQGQGCVSLRRPRCWRHRRLDDQPVPVLREDMAQEAQLGLLPRGLLVQSRLRIGRRGMRRIRPPLPPKVHTGIARILGRWHRGDVRLGLEALLPCPGLDQRAIDGEVFIGQQPLGPRLGQHLLEERRRDFSRQQPIPVLREHGHIPDGRIQIEADKPAEQQVVIQLFHQQAFTPNAVEHLQQQGSQQLLWGDRGTTSSGIQCCQHGRQGRQGGVDRLANEPQRMGRRHPRLGREITEETALLQILTTHRQTSLG